jgi:hypothetical protein
LKQLNQLFDSKSKEGGIDRKALEELAAKAPGFAGAISCFSGQTVHIASAQSRSAVTGAVPVVGGGPEGVGYQPIIANPQSGAVLQVTPQLLPMHDTHAAVLDVCSVVTRSEGPAETLTFMSGAQAGVKRDDRFASTTGITLDRVNMSVAQLATTLRVPLGTPVLVGGLTRQPSCAKDDSAAAAPQLYLFIEATVR